MKLFTHSYKIVFFEEGRFCWKNKGWVKNETQGIFVGVQQVMLIGFVFVVIQLLSNLILR